MNYIVIDTTKKVAHIVGNIAGKNYRLQLGADEKHSENLLVSIDRLLTNAGVTIEDIECFGVVVGPGSFTGIRVGIATVKAFCYGKDKKVVAFTNFDVVASYVGTGNMLMSSTSTTYYNASIVKGKVKETKVIEKTLAKAPYFGLLEEQSTMPQDVNMIDHFDEMLIAYMNQCISSQQFVSIDDVQPYYLQLSQAERELVNKND